MVLGSGNMSPLGLLTELVSIMAGFIYHVILVVIMFTMATKLCIGSYNSKGLGVGRIEYIKRLTEVNDILLLQEHWLFESGFGILEKEFSNMSVYAVSAMNEDEYLSGRPYGGCAILLKKSLKCGVTPIQCESKRLCCVLIESNGIKILFFSIYMPTDTEHDTENIIEFMEVLSCVNAISAQMSCDTVILGGDFNTDLSRHNSLHTKYLNQFATKEGLRNVLDYSGIRDDYTYESHVNGNRSFIDHFYIAQNLFNCIGSHSIQHDGDNLSDHSAILLSINISLEYEDEKKHISCHKIKWKEASVSDINKYKAHLDDLLSNIYISEDVVGCQDIFCSEHRLQIQEFHDNILKACLEAGDTNIPHTGKGYKKVIPGWNDNVAEIRQQAIFWHQLWKCNNCPTQGVLADVRKYTRAKYHYALRDIKRNIELNRANSMADALLNNKTRSFWSEIQKVKASTKSVPNMVDSIQGSDAISKHFADIYRNLYNIVSYKEEDMQMLNYELECKLRSKCLPHICNCGHVFNREIIVKAVKKVKRGKSDGESAMFTDHLKNGTNKLFECISILLTCMLRHGYAPKTMMTATILPIPKDKKKSLNVSSNYRGIALSSILAKVLEGAILICHDNVLCSSDMQFGFKSKCSTTKCTFAVSEIINYYFTNQTKVHAVLLDASKAFDRVHYVKLFGILLRKGLCPMVVRLLMYMYTQQKVNVRWGNATSESFEVTNGVKQGGVLSPVLFSIYMDDLLDRLKKAKLGCYIGNIFCGALAYADDLILLAPTRSAMEMMVQICSIFAHNFDVKFNPDKSQHIIFNQSVSPQRYKALVMDGKTIPNVTHSIHLGIPIGRGANNIHFNQVIYDLHWRTNAVLAYFKKIHASTKYRLFKSYCMSLYGSPLFEMYGRSIEPLYVTWRKCIRKLLGISNRTRSALLPLLCDDYGIKAVIHKRFVRFVHSLFNSDGDILAMCGKLLLKGSTSTVGSNLNYLCHSYHIDRYQLKKMTNYNIMKLLKRIDDRDTSVEMLTRARNIKDLIYIKEHQVYCILDSHEIEILLNYMCEFEGNLYV